MRNLKTFCVLICLWSSCTTAPVNERMSYLPLTSLLDSICNDLDKQPYSLIKKVNYAGKEETVVLMNPDWKKELEPFFDGDINKPAYAGSYSVDTIIRGDTVLFRYLTTDKKIPVKNLSVFYTDAKLYSINIRIEKSNAWFSLEQELSMKPADGYNITGKQKMAVGKEVNFKIAGRFIPENTTTK
jgi:hypothetical protein